MLLFYIDTSLLDIQLRDYLKRGPVLNMVTGGSGRKQNIRDASATSRCICIPKGRAIEERRDLLIRKLDDKMKYIMDNMKYFEADDSKLFAFEKDVELNEYNIIKQNV